MRTRAACVLLGFAAAAGCGDDATPPTATPNDGGVVDDAGSPQDDAEADAGPPLPGLDSRPSNLGCIAPARPATGSLTIQLDPFQPASTFRDAVDARQPPGDSSRWYVVERHGTIRSMNATTGAQALVLDITSRVESTQSQEAGLLGMAFHPSFSQNGYVYVVYTHPHPTQPPPLYQTYLWTVSRFHSADGGVTLDPNSEQILIQEPHPFPAHNGGKIDFGPDGYLYVSRGDGGGGGDPFHNGQNTNVLMGKLLRLDVDKGSPYAIPPTNPFAQGGGKPEIFAYGFRNPWRFAFDRATGEIWLADVGQSEWEEIDRVTLGGNYGWSVLEGTHCYEAATCDRSNTIAPIFEYSHSFGQSISGGFVYRGAAMPALYGKYIFGDWGTTKYYALTTDADGKPTASELIPTIAPGWVVGLAEANDGELYHLGYADLGLPLYKISAAAPPPPSTFPTTLSKTGCVDPNDTTKPAAGVIPYSLRSPLWSDGATKERYFAIPDGTTIDVKPNGDFDFPKGTVLMKSFSVDGKRVETRLFVRHDDGDWGGYSYEWNDAGTDATLLPASKLKQLGNGKTWYYPSRSECLACHTQAAGRALGPELAQLAGDATYPTGRKASQIDTLRRAGYLQNAPAGDPATLPALPDPTDTTQPLGARARAYLHANCSGCHRPGGPTPVDLDLRYTTQLGDTGTCGERPVQDLGIAGARVIAPGDPAHSVLSARIHSKALHRMPPLATFVVDPAGTALVDSWIQSLKSCPPPSWVSGNAPKR